MIDLNNLSAQRGEFRVKIESLKLKQGELVAILGNNGSGKSTFLATLAGFIPYRGSYALGQCEYNDQPQKERNKLVALLPQKTELNMPFDVFYVILTGRFLHTDGFRYSKKDYQATTDVLKRFDIEHLKNRPYNELSGGEKQRVLLARTINQEAPVLLLDEPLNGIDLKHQHETVSHLHAFKREKTILVVMHDLSLAIREFDRFLIFLAGKLVYDVKKSDIEADKLAEIFKVNIEFKQQADRLYVYTSAQ